MRRGKTKSTLSTETRPPRRQTDPLAFPVSFRTVPPSAPVVSGYILSTSQVTSIRDKFVRETEVPVIRLFALQNIFCFPYLYGFKFDSLNRNSTVVKSTFRSLFCYGPFISSISAHSTLCLSGHLEKLRLPRARPQTRPDARTRNLSKGLPRHKVQVCQSKLPH